MSFPDHAFKQLAQIFMARDNRVLEIEILPPALGPLLQDGCSIGITKEYLVQAYVAARTLFFKAPEIMAKLGASSTKPQNDTENECFRQSLENISVASEIILLFDCEHLTACNWRKRRLLSIIQSCKTVAPINQESLIGALSSELTLMATYVCSPLRRHTKSPTLWEHRIWVLKYMLHARVLMLAQSHPRTSVSEPPSLRIEAMLDLWKEELSIAFRAGELHPRNYYAFSHLREFHQVLSCWMEDSADSSAVLAQLASSTALEWCLAHTTDISGWMFLLYLLQAIPSLAVRTNSVIKVACFARDIGWEGESLWTFIALAVHNFRLADPVRDILCISHKAPTEAGLGPIHDTRKEVGQLELGWKDWLTMARINWVSSQ